MDFSNSARGTGSPTQLFLERVGELVEPNSKQPEDISRLWASACKDTWATALRDFTPSRPAGCNHRGGRQEGIDRFPTDSEAPRSTEAATHKSLEPASALFDLQESYITAQTTSKSQDDLASGILGKEGTTQLELSDGNSNVRSQTSSDCARCTGDDPSVFPFVSNIAPLAILMFLEAVQNHKELSFSPLIPAYTHERPEYLNKGMSFRVIHVPWQQVRTDTDGRILTDAVYKRLNRSATRKSWLEFMKDLVVTHHMTYHVSASHKRNIVKLIGLGWEHVIDDFLGEPTIAPVIALEYAPHGTLEDLFYSSSFLSSYQRRVRLLVDVAEGLEALHFSNIIHGDIKPQNILIFSDIAHGIIAKLCDFGMAVIDPDCGPELQHLPGGTLRYSAPEASKLIPRDRLKYTDVYSFGIVAWQTLLGGTMPFFSSRYRGGQSLDDGEIHDLKTGKHIELGGLYGIQVDPYEFSRLNRGEELQQDNYEPPNDLVNTLLIAIARDSLEQVTGPTAPEGEIFTVPFSELPALLSLLQISLSSCPIHRRLDCILILLGVPYEGRQIAVSRIKWENKVKCALLRNPSFQTVAARARELYSSIFESFFVALQRNPRCANLDTLGQWDAVLARYLGSALVEYYIWKFLAGDHSNETRTSLLQCLALCSSAGDLGTCSASLGIHQLLGVDMKWTNLYTMGTALALIKGDNALFWYTQQPAHLDFGEQVHAGLIRRSQGAIIEEHNRIAGHVQLGHKVGPIDVNIQNDQGDTLLHIACRMGHSPLACTLIRDHHASASVLNNFGEGPIHWLHRFPVQFVEFMAVLLVQAGADIECYSPPRFGDYISVSNHSLFPTPLLRAVARRNVAAVTALVNLGAKVSSVRGSTYAGLEMSPLSFAASMLDDECLGVMLPAWSPESPQAGGDADNTEAHILWDSAIGGSKGIDRIKEHGDQYGMRVKRTLEILTRYVGPCYVVRNARPSLFHAVEGGDLEWVEAILERLYSNSSQAVLVELQLGLECAVAQGYRHIAVKLMEFGALPLLPHRWSLSNYTSGRPGRWSKDLVDRLIREGRICFETNCCLHICATGGGEAVAIAEDILRRPVVNSCLMPSLPVQSNGRHFVIQMIDGMYPRLDRLDEDRCTPLYNAMANGEFELARRHLAHGASYDLEKYEWSLAAQIFEDGRASLPNQIEFLLSNEVRRPAFNFKRRVFGRLHPPSRHILHEMEPDPENYVLEEYTIITALAEACKSLDVFDKGRCWEAVLPVFNEVTQILAKAENRKDALQIAIESADHYTLKLLVDRLKMDPQCFDYYSVVDQVRDLLLSQAPASIANNYIKKKIISFRCNLGKMVEVMLGAGDQGRNERKDLREAILETISNEYPILVIGFQQRGDGSESKENFKRDSENFCNALMTTLYSCPRTQWFEVLEGLENDLRLLLSPYFVVHVNNREYSESSYRRGAKVKLSYKQTPTSPRSRMWKGSQQVEPLLDWDLYRNICAKEMWAQAPNTSAVPSFKLTQVLLLRSLGFAIARIPSADFLTATTLLKMYPDRKVDMTARVDRPDPAYYFRAAPWKENTRHAMIEADSSKHAYFEVIRQLNPQAKSLPKQKMIKAAVDLLQGHVDSLIDTRALTTIDSASLHPFFAYARSGQKLPDELQGIDGLSDFQQPKKKRGFFGKIRQVLGQK